ncbi:hypothetical protein [uncultured Sphingomonas sp.]|uniref:hypothetical protein n=1 Tax=uncultured Sphingomonas sp. TaxID=158754 RepID=UPI0025D9B800|nr:hypothetical protein [uncultured Sphingomonas sp.]
MKWGVAVIAAAVPAAAAAQGSERPEILTKLIECRRIDDAGARLRCLDTQVGQLVEAERTREVVIIDRGDAKRPEFTEINSRLKSVNNAGGRWRLTLEDEATWIQADSEELARAPRPGSSIRIRKGVLGSFLANIDRQPAIRVRQVR